MKLSHKPFIFAIAVFLTIFTILSDVADNATIRLDLDNQPQPDALMRIKKGGRSRISKDDHIEGAPELIVEIAGSTASYDLHDKLQVYRRHGVKEYIVWQVYSNQE